MDVIKLGHREPRNYVTSRITHIQLNDLRRRQGYCSKGHICKEQAIRVKSYKLLSNSFVLAIKGSEKEIAAHRCSHFTSNPWAAPKVEGFKSKATAIRFPGTRDIRNKHRNVGFGFGSYTPDLGYREADNIVLKIFCVERLLEIAQPFRFTR